MENTSIEDLRVESLFQAAKAAHVEYVRFTVTDMYGIGKSKTVPLRELKKFLRSGLCMYKGVTAFSPRNIIVRHPSIDGVPDCLMMAEPGTFRCIPWAGHPKVGEVQCETRELDGTYMTSSPRYIARQQLVELRKMGYEMYYSQECEFNLVKHGIVTNDRLIKDTNFAENQLWLNYQDPRTKSFLFNLEKALSTAGVRVENFHSESGDDQLEVTLSPETGIMAADNIILTRHAIKEYALQLYLSATFMTKPYPGLMSNGGHFNHSLQDERGRNVFSDTTTSDNLSEMAGYWIAGLIKHAPAMAAICSPTFNCYRRLHHHGAPSKGDWKINNRSVLYRVKNHTESATYIESRLPSGAGNPYLIVAVHVAAGMDGIKNKLQLPTQKDPNATLLPSTLQEALAALQADKIIMDALGDEFLDWWIRVKQQVELGELTHTVNIETEQVYYKERMLFFQNI